MLKYGTYKIKPDPVGVKPVSIVQQVIISKLICNILALLSMIFHG